VVSEIRIYVEGGGPGKHSKAAMRRGFGEFLTILRNAAQERHVCWHIVACGPRNDAFDAFCTALKTHTGAFNVLLVDSEGPVTTRPLQHLGTRDGWAIDNSLDEHCHLMVQMMESWFVADIDALENFYGNGFQRSAFPERINVEVIDKATLEHELKSATRDTRKGRYAKARHGPELLGRLDPDKVRRKAPHCERLFATLSGKIGAPI